MLVLPGNWLDAQGAERRCVIGLTYAEAKALGIEHLWPSRTDKPAALDPTPGLPETKNDPNMNKLEAAFWERLQTAGYEQVYHEPFKLRLAGHCHYTIDFGAVALNPPSWDLFETKGSFAREDSIIKIKIAASLYPSFRFYLVTRPAKKWAVRAVTNRGISKDYWLPSWLR